MFFRNSVTNSLGRKAKYKNLSDSSISQSVGTSCWKWNIWTHTYSSHNFLMKLCELTAHTFDIYRKNIVMKHPAFCTTISWIRFIVIVHDSNEERMIKRATYFVITRWLTTLASKDDGMSWRVKMASSSGSWLITFFTLITCWKRC